jgi:hypothetical protein
VPTRNAVQAEVEPSPGTITVRLPKGTLQVDTAKWTPMGDEYEWAENFEARQREERHIAPRIVTVFKLPMTDDGRVGTGCRPRPTTAQSICSMTRNQTQPTRNREPIALSGKTA